MAGMCYRAAEKNDMDARDICAKTLRASAPGMTSSCIRAGPLNRTWFRAYIEASINNERR